MNYKKELNKYQHYLDFIDEYAKSSNAATGSKVDSNANVEHKNVTTLTGEIYKSEGIGINRLRMYKKLTSMFGEEYAKKYIDQLESHLIYKHDETNPLLPYTYGAHEVVNVKYNGKTYTVPFYRLYELCEDEEDLLDSEREVYAKYPDEMYVEDNGGFTKVTRLVRKRRHRDLVRIKTSFSNDIIVTDNHPIIVNEDINDTVPADESLGKNQYRVKSLMGFGDVDEIDTSRIADTVGINYYVLEDCVISQVSNGSSYYASPNKIKIDRELGYVVGFFIGDGDYDMASSSLRFTQKKKDVLEKIANIMYKRFSAPSIIRYDMSCDKYTLTVKNPIAYLLFKKIFNICPYSANKSLPENIFDYTKDFSIGVIEGIIDSDGSIDGNGSYSVRISSRTAICQLSAVLNALGITTGMSTQQTCFGQNDKVTQKYQLFGIRFREPVEEKIFTNSVKSKKAIQLQKGTKGSFDEWQLISNVDKIDNAPYLEMNEFIYDITTKSHTFVCNGFWVHNCVSITMYPFLFEGLHGIGGGSGAPHNLDSFAGSFVNLCFAIASQFAGAVSTPEFLSYMDYFIRKEYGNDYYKNPDKIVDLSSRNRSIDKVICDKFEQIVYSLNQPAAARNFQSIFWNIAYFDKPYFDGLFEDFVFPDGSSMNWESVSWLQKRFMKWFNKERTKQILTFPVETLNLLDDGEKYVDEEWADFCAEMLSEGHSFFNYRSNSVDSLASCCRLRNELQDNTFSFTLGAGGVSTGSKSVITINMNRLIQMAVKNKKDILESVKEEVQDVHKFLLAYNELLKDMLHYKLLPIYDAGFISLDKQFLTIGINGLVEGCEFLGYKICTSDSGYHDFVNSVLKVIYDENKASRTKEIMFNTEYVPAENLGVKNAKWDKEDGLFSPRDCYNSYFYLVEDTQTTLLDKFILHGEKFTKYLDGGAALHGNLEEHLSKEQYRQIMDVAIKTGCSYWTVNIPNTICNDCGFISKHKLHKCPKCGSENLDYATRVIGYLKRVSNFSEARQKEESRRYYAHS